MTALLAPRPAVKTTRRRPTAAALARALEAALRRLEEILPVYCQPGGAMGRPRKRFLERTWFPAVKAAGRAQAAVLEMIRDREVLGIVRDGKLFLDVGACFPGSVDYTCQMEVAIVPLASIPDLAARRPAAPDWPTPLEALDDGTDHAATPHALVCMGPRGPRGERFQGRTFDTAEDAHAWADRADAATRRALVDGGYRVQPVAD
jgi:hypothetical protein